jgi:eukaryotic-like serine/threonine-protein kinase
MFVVFQCVAQAIKDKGIRGLCDLIPGGPYVFDVAAHAYKLLRERQKEAALKEEIAKVAAASVAEARQAAAEVAKQVASGAPIEERIALELYLTQLSGAVRQSLKRPEDPTGKTVPPNLVFDTPEDFVKMLPVCVPHFRPGGDLPGRPGWRLDELLGAGGFGEVWLARHSFLPHPRAVKFCTDAKVRAKLTSHEGKVIARVMEQGNHPNVVPLLDAVLDGETPWLMYEFVGGGSLTDLIHRWQNLSEGERESLTVLSLAQLATAVGTFHRLAPAIVHRDLKPANILLASSRQPVDGAALAATLRITDFGIGGVAVDYLRTHPGGMSLMTGWLETSMRGSYTPLYASPQQSRGMAPDPRDDVHALGVIAFQMLTGKLTEAPSPRFERDLKRRGVTDGLIELIGDCVDSEPSGRPRDAVELAERLGKLKVPTVAMPAASPLVGESKDKTATPAKASPEGGSLPTALLPFAEPLEPTKKPSEPSFPRAAEIANASEARHAGQSLRAAEIATASEARHAGLKAEGKDKPVKGPLEGGSAPTTVLPFAETLEPTKWLVPLRGMWFSRSTETPDAPWAVSSVRLPGEVMTRPGEAYRLTLNPDTTGDTELEKLKALTGLPGLEAIDLSGCVRVTDAGLMHLAQLRGLKAVGLADTQVTDSGVTLLLTRFPDLEAVGLAGTTNVSQTVIPYLARLRKLKILALPPRADTIDVRVEFSKRRPACQLV